MNTVMRTVNPEARPGMHPKRLTIWYRFEQWPIVEELLDKIRTAEDADFLYPLVRVEDLGVDATTGMQWVSLIIENSSPAMIPDAPADRTSVPVGKQDVQVADVHDAVAGDVTGARRGPRRAASPIRDQAAEIGNADDPVVVDVPDASACERDPVGEREFAGGNGAHMTA